MRDRPAGSQDQGVWGNPRLSVLAVAILTLLTGCLRPAQGPPLGGTIAASTFLAKPKGTAEHTDEGASQQRTQEQGRHGAHFAPGGGSSPAGMVALVAAGALMRLDAFEQVLVYAGIEHADDLPPREAPLTPEDAADLHDKLLGLPVTLAGFGPRLVAGFLLREVMEGEEEVARKVLLRRVQRFRSLAVLRPDGYLAWTLSGDTQQWVGSVQWSAGAFRAGRFEVGRFYTGRTGAFFPVDAQLERADSSPLAEVYDDADVISRVLDGSQEAFVELGLAVEQLVNDPIGSFTSLSQLPQGLATLITSSPRYWERFRHRTRGEQLQALSRLTTTLLATYGTVVGTTRTLVAAGRGVEVVSVPALSLTAEGALVVERVAVPVGRVVTVLGGGPGAAIILQRANQAGGGRQPAPAQGPGQWGPARESMSKRAARYQEQIAGHHADEAYWVGGMDRKSGGVKFDGFEDGVLLEAKGPGYANKFNDDLKPKRWFQFSGAKQLVSQAERQVRAASGVPIRWHVAEKKATNAIRELLYRAGVQGIEVVHTPMLP